MCPKLKEVKALEDYKVLLIFRNGEQRIYDMKELLKYDFYKNIRDKEKFQKVKVADGITIEWEDGEDVDPCNLYINSKPVREEDNESKK